MRRMSIAVAPLDIGATDCVAMKVVGPNVSRLALGEHLARLREEARLSLDQVADAIGVGTSQMRKIESGDRKIRRSDLTVMLDMFEVPRGDRLRTLLDDLVRSSDQRGWWAEYGMLPERFATLLSFEGSAVTIRSFEPLVVHGLLQTEAYARAISERDRRIDMTPDQAQTQVEIKLQRQEVVFGSEQQAEVHVVFDEAAIRRVVGGPGVMAEQLGHLVKMADRPNIRIQVIPYDQGAHPGMFGAFEIFEFEELHSPIAYVEGQAGILYLEKAEDLTRCNLAWTDLVASALSPQDSVRMIAGIARELGA